MVICKDWTVFKVGSIEVHTSPDSTRYFPKPSHSPRLPFSLLPFLQVCPLRGLSPLSLRPAIEAGAPGLQRWGLWLLIFNCMQKYIYIKNVEQCLFNSDTLYLLFNRCLRGQLTRNYLSITFRLLYVHWLARQSLGFKHVCYSLWFPSF